jgi:hypothetical protein
MAVCGVILTEFNCQNRISLIKILILYLFFVSNLKIRKRGE